ncbi:MAG: hypothetical protein LBC18_05615, partial [Opitutaceae bacterium]|nr:hypothetical protein [Opitutaceae bacterium]
AAQGKAGKAGAPPPKIAASALTLAQIQSFDAGAWKDARFAGERIPTLAASLALIKNSPAAAVVEIKENNIEPGVLDAIRAAGLENRSVVIAFSRDVVREIRRLAPAQPVAWLYSAKPGGDPRALADMLSLTARRLDTPLLDLNHRILTKEVVDLLHQRGFTVWAWTVDDPDRMAELLSWGVDSITTNKPALLKEVRGGK